MPSPQHEIMKGITIRPETPENFVASVVEQHQTWIESRLGASLLNPA
jgi:hypothetical protein